MLYSHTSQLPPVAPPKYLTEDLPLNPTTVTIYPKATTSFFFCVLCELFFFCLFFFFLWSTILQGSILVYAHRE